MHYPPPPSPNHFGFGNRLEQARIRRNTTEARGNEHLGEEAGGGEAIALSPGLVADTALASLNLHSGIMMLEEGIMRASKRHPASAESAAAAAAKAGKARDYFCFLFRCLTGLQ